MTNDFKEKNLTEWENILLDLFNGEIPLQRTWEKNTDILKVLNQIIPKHPQTHDTLLPSGGGLDLIGANNSVEPGCIELYFDQNSAGIVKPTVLFFQSFGVPYEWDYFRLEIDKLEPSGIYEDLQIEREELTEISPGNYIGRSFLDEENTLDENGEEQPLPKSARLVVRHCSAGSFVILAHMSSYNLLPNTYNGLHSEMNSNQFKQYVQTAIMANVPNAKKAI